MQRFKSFLFQKKTSAIQRQNKRKADINKVKRANENTSMCTMLVQQQEAGEKNKHFLMKSKKNKEKNNLQSVKK